MNGLLDVVSTGDCLIMFIYGWDEQNSPDWTIRGDYGETVP